MARDGRPLRTITTPPARSPATAGRSPRARSSSPSRPTARRSPTPTSPTAARSPRPAARSSARRSTQRHDEATPSRLRQPVQRLRPRVGDQRPHARLRRLRAPGGDRRPRPGRLQQQALDGARTATWATARSPATASGSRSRPTTARTRSSRSSRSPATSRPSSRPRIPSFACEMTHGDERYADPTWAPDNAGHRLREQRGHHRVALHRVRAGRLRGAERLRPERDRLAARLGPGRRRRPPPTRRRSSRPPGRRTPDPVTPAPTTRPPVVKLAIVKATRRARKGP